jgi:hypothetical protein
MQTCKRYGEAGLIRAMEGAYGEVNGRWYDYKVGLRRLIKVDP